MNRGFGSPTMTYYPPGIYYVTSAFYATSGDWIIALLGTHLLMMLCSAAAIYVYARQTMSTFAAAVVMALYIFLPYRLMDQYVRGALAELSCFVWMPLILLFGEKLFRRREHPNAEDSLSASRRLICISGFAVSYGAFIWSHPPTAYQFSLAFGLYLVILAWLRRDFIGLIYAGAAITLGLAVSAAYLYPAAAEEDLIRNEYVSEAWPYHDSYVFRRGLYDIASHQLLIDSIWLFGAVLILACALVLLAIKSNSKTLSPSLKERVALWIVMGGFASFMMTEFSYPIGRIIPKIDMGIFAWRMLSITTLALALLAGACVQASLKTAEGRKKSYLFALRSLAVVIALGGVIFGGAVIIARAFSARPPFAPSVEHMNFATIPRSANKDLLALPIVEPAELTEGNGRISIERWESHHRSILVDLVKPDQLLIRTFDFPGWAATIDGKPAEIKHGSALRLRLNEVTDAVTISGRDRPVRTNENFEALVRSNDSTGDKILVRGKPVEVIGRETVGDINLDLPEGRHRINLDFLESTPTRIANLITISSFSLVVLVSVGAFIQVSRAERKKRLVIVRE
ncbi:MAG TPA: 6-pyruvoyl-tetrahydropterin synthase-related protein [Blastocatellia bacterium]|nr:6-pyruvoyl-tetrahydropterin synthase-related protein [Blastocatellia bacterium]